MKEKKDIAKNSFKELEREQAEAYKKNTERVHNRVKGSMGMVGLLTEIIELYFSRIVDVFINISNTSSLKDLETEEEE